MTEPEKVDLVIDPDLLRQMAEEQEKDWLEAMPFLKSLGMDLVFDEAEEKQKSKDRLAQLDQTLANLKKQP